MTVGREGTSPKGGRGRFGTAGSVARQVRRYLKGAFQGTAKLIGLLIWLAIGVVFWIPLLVRRLILFVLEVLVAGLTGGDTATAARQLDEAARFYWTGIERITSAFEPEDRRHESRADLAERRRRRKPRRRVLFEILWALFFWGALAWAVGIWPEAPTILAAALQDLWNLASEVGRGLRRWWYNNVPQ